MATREEIREGLTHLYCAGCYEGISDRCVTDKNNRPCEYARIETDKVLLFLDSKGVVRKDRLLTFECEPVGYEVEPLIEVK